MTKPTKTLQHSLGKDFETLVENIRSSSDRIAVIVTGAFFHDLLLDRIAELLVDDYEAREKLFHPTNGNMSTYATLVDLAYLLGLIPSQVRDWMKLLGHLRNHFAHKWGADSFSDLETASDKDIKTDLKKLREFKYPSVVSKDKYALRDHFDALSNGIVFAFTDRRYTVRLQKMEYDLEIADGESFHHAFMKKHILTREGITDIGSPFSNYLQQLMELLASPQVPIIPPAVRSDEGKAPDRWLDALNQLPESSNRLKEVINLLAQKSLSHAEKMRNAGIVDEALLSSFNTELAIILTDFANGIETELADIRRNWEIARAGLINQLKLPLESHADVEALQDLNVSLTKSLSVIDYVLSQVTLLNQSLDQLRGVTLEVQQSKDRAQNALDDLIEIFTVGKAYFSRVIAQIERKIKSNS